MLVSETTDGILRLMSLTCPVRAVPQLATTDSILHLGGSYPGYFGDRDGLMMFSEMYKPAGGAFQSRALTSKFTKLC